MTPGGTFIPGQSVRFNSVTNTNEYRYVQGPHGQTQFTKPPQNVRHGAYFHQQVQPQVHQNQLIVQASSAQVRQLQLRHNQLVDTSPNGSQSFQMTAPPGESGGASGFLPNQSPNISLKEAPFTAMSSTSSMPSTPNGTQKNCTNIVRELSSSLSARENEQSVVSASLSNHAPSTSSKTPTDVPWSEKQSLSLPAGQTKRLNPNIAVASPAQLGSGQDSIFVKGGKVTPIKDTCLDSTVSQGESDYSQSMPVQPLAGIKLSHDPDNTVNLTTCTETETPAGTIGSLTDREDKEGNNSFSLKPVLRVEQSDNGIILSWDLTSREGESKVIKYELYVMSVPTESAPLNEWESLGVVDALALPMACTMTQFLSGASYYFAVRAITANGNCELFSDPCSINVI